MRGRLIRLWSLVEALAGLRRGLSIRALGERLGVSRATVYRDIGVLRDAGIPIAQELHNGEARYRLLGEGLPARQLGPRERAAIAIARHALAGLEGTSLIETLDGAVGSSAAGGLPIGARVRATARSPKIMRVLDRALRERLRLRLRYRGTKDEAARTRDVDPGALHVQDGHPYLLAFALDRNEWRTFKVARIAWVEPLGPAQSHPGLEAQTALAHAVRVWSGEPVQVCVRLAPAVAWLAPEWPLVPDQQIEMRPDGSALIRADVAGLVEARRWVLGWGRNATVMAPAELATSVRAELAEALGSYSATAPEEVVSPIMRRPSRRQSIQRGNEA